MTSYCSARQVYRDYYQGEGGIWFVEISLMCSILNLIIWYHVNGVMSSGSDEVASFIIFVQWEKCLAMTRSLIRAKKQNKYVGFMG